jgi:hypothetical protein
MFSFCEPLELGTENSVLRYLIQIIMLKITNMTVGRIFHVMENKVYRAILAKDHAVKKNRDNSLHNS